MIASEMRTFLAAHVPGFDPESDDAAVVAAYADYQAGAAAQEPLSLEQAKKNLRYEDDDQDDLITDLIVDAREYVERETGLVLTPRTVTETTLTLGRWVDLKAWPVTSVVVRHSVDGVMTVLDSAGYIAGLSRRPVRLQPLTIGWGSAVAAQGTPTLPVEIVMQAGYATPADVPRNATRAMHMLIGHWFANRSAAEVGARAASIDVPYGVDELIDRLRVQLV